MPVTINQWLTRATDQLSDLPSNRLDAELILAHTIRKPRTFLHAHGDETLSERHQEIAEARIALRLDRVPIAYIIGHKDFYGRQFTVTPSTLIPRPESEQIISLLLEEVQLQPSLLYDEPFRLVDVGTGSGCLGITAKLERPDFDVTLLDTSRHALAVATKNAARLSATVTIMQSNLLERYPFRPYIILANLPYVDPAWERSPETAHEPADALFASDKGLQLIKKLIIQASTRLRSDGWLMLEADDRQHEDMISYAKDHGFRVAAQRGLIVALRIA